MEIQFVVLVFVKRAEDVLGELCGVAIWKVLDVNIFELFDAELSIRKVFAEVFVPISNLGLTEARRL